ncbi:hypothetical protein D3C87_1182930 [compost metagenome]
MNANPISLIITAVVGLGVALVVAYQKSETFRNIVNGLWSSMVSVFSSTIAFFTTTIPGVFTQLWNSTTSIFTGIWNTAVSIWNSIVSSISTAGSNVLSSITGVWDTISSTASNLWTGISNGVSGMWTGIKNFFIDGINWVINKINGLIGSLNSAMNVELPDWMGGGAVGVTIPTIPTINGSHADGLANVPFDGYIAELHAGERVLTAPENKAYSGGSPETAPARVAVGGSTSKMEVSLTVDVKGSGMNEAQTSDLKSQMKELLQSVLDEALRRGGFEGATG